MCLLACQWQWSDSTDTWSLLYEQEKASATVSWGISESKLCSGQSQPQIQVQEIQNNKKRIPWHTTADNNPAIIQQTWKKYRSKMQASKFRFVNDVITIQHRKRTRIHLSASWYIFRYAKVCCGGCPSTLYPEQYTLYN